jgi:hypothetical protein
MMEEKNMRHESGQSIVLVAVAFLGLILFVTIAVDIGNAYVQRRTAQNAADGAALAGTGELALQINADLFNDAQIKTAMNDFAERNGIEDKGGTLADALNLNVVGYYLDEGGERIANKEVGAGSVPKKAWGIEAITYITSTTFFGGIVGLDGLPLDATAAVVLGKTCVDDCVVPIATHDRVFITSTDPYSPCYNIWNGTGPGNFGWLNWSWQALYGDPATPPEDCRQDDCSAQCLGQNLLPEDCNSGFVAVDDWVAGTTGVTSDVKVRKALDHYIDNLIPFTVIVWHEIYCGDGQTSEECEGAEGQGCGPWPSGLHYRVKGFARMQLLGYKLAEGEGNAHDPWVDPLQCVPLGEVPGDDPNAGNRLTAKFLPWTSGQGGGCQAEGTVYGLRLTK